VKILPRGCRTVSSYVRRSIRSHPSASRLRRGPSGPFTIWCLTCPSVRASASRRLHRPTCPRQHPVGPGTRPGIRPVIRKTTGGGAGHAGLAFLLPFSCRRSLLGHPFPPRDSAPLTVGLPSHPTIYRDETDLGGVSMFRTWETRLGWVASGLRGRRCSRDRSGVLGRRLPPLNGAVPATLVFLPAPRFDNDEASARIHGLFTRPAFPSPVAPGRNEDPWTCP
jgi:hypothetical protein